jgi:hypothetical protein
MAYDTFFKPPTIIGVWKGSRLDFEIGKPIIHTQYGLVLDDKKNASLTLGGDYTTKGTYAVKGNRLKLTFKDDDGEKSVQEYKISLGMTTMDLLDPSSGKKVVELIRQSAQPTSGTAPPPAPAKELAAGGADVPADKAADLRLASVEFSPKDGAFKLRYPKGWDTETGSRPDNTYSWGRFTNGSAKIQAFADVQGSLMSGSDSARQPQEEGSPLAPVQTAHDLYKRTVAEEYSDFKESAATLFKGSSLGEGRIAAFTASGGGVFGAKLSGYRVTLLTNNRRVTLLCECPAADFAKLKPTFLAVCRSVSN